MESELLFVFIYPLNSASWKYRMAAESCSTGQMDGTALETRQSGSSTMLKSEPFKTKNKEYK